MARRDWEYDDGMVTVDRGGYASGWKLRVARDRDPDRSIELCVDERGYGTEDREARHTLSREEARGLRSSLSEAIAVATGERVQELRSEERLTALSLMAGDIRGTAEMMLGSIERTPHPPEKVLEIVKDVLRNVVDRMQRLAAELERKEENG